MAKHIVKAMLPEQNVKVHKRSLHEGKVHRLEMCICYIFCIFIILSQPWMVINWWILLDFYWIDPMVTAERIAAKSQYAVRYISHMQNMFNMQNHVNKCIFGIFCI